jgi:hypothetical protein
MQRLLDTRFPEGWEERVRILTSSAKAWRERNGRFREMMVTREIYERERKRPANNENWSFVR